MDSGPSPGKGSRALQSDRAYSSWKQVAGYFDGDGNVRVEVRVYVLRIGIRFVDTWKPQLEAIRSFLVREGIILGHVGLGGGSKSQAYRLDIGEQASVLKAIRAMISLCVKKQEDLRIALDYLEERITGDEAIASFRSQYLKGRRRGNVRLPEMPYTRKQGLRLYELTNARKAWEAHTVKVDPVTKAKIVEDHEKFGLGVGKLSAKYGYTHGVLRRILREESKANPP